MRLAVDSFRGESPRITPRALPPNGAQRAVNCRLQSGDLEAWRQFLEIERLGIAPMTIYRLLDQWMAWGTDVDVARSPIPGDQDYTVYLTGPDEYAQPRWTNYAMAFQSPGGTPPVLTRPIGVPNPDAAPTLVAGVDDSPTTFSIDITDDNESLATSWSVNSALTGATYATVTQQYGYYEVLFDENRSAGTGAYAYRNFGVAGVSVLQASVDFYMTRDPSFLQAFMVVGASLAGSGIGILYENGFLQIRKVLAWSPAFGAAVVATTNITPLSFNTSYSLRANVVTNEDGTKTVTASVYSATDVLLGTITGTNNFEDGDYCAFGGEASTSDTAPAETRYSNYSVQASGSTNATVTNVATSYVFTHVNDLGQQSGPSAASATILRPDGVSVTVTTPIVPPSGVSDEYEIETKRIYRAVTGATGSIFRFVAEIPLSQADYVDTLTDAQLGEALESEGWELPPDDLRGILALPNGIMVGFRRNQVCFAVQNRPHAWRVADRAVTDTDVVAIGAIDTTVVIGTKSFPYVAQGNTSDSYATGMAKLEVPQACVSKRGLTYVSGLGVVFPSPDGYMAITGVSAPVNITRAFFTRKQWQALVPESIFAVPHDDVLHFFFDTGPSTARGGYMADLKPDGFGLVETAYHATAAHADPLTDDLYLALDENDEPTAPYLPQAGTAPIPDGRTIYQFDGDPDSLMAYLWRGPLNLVPPFAPTFVRVQAGDFDNLMVRGYRDGELAFEEVVTSAEVFRVNDGGETAEVSFEQEVIGTSRVRTFQITEDIEEIV